MTISFQTLAPYLPINAVVPDASGNASIDFGALVGAPVPLTSSVCIGLDKLLEGLAKLTTDINTAREAANPVQPDIAFVTQAISTDNSSGAGIGDITIVYTVQFTVNSSLIALIVKDPTT